MEARPPKHLRVLCGGKYLIDKGCVQFGEYALFVSCHGPLNHVAESAQRKVYNMYV